MQRGGSWYETAVRYNEGVARTLDGMQMVNPLGLIQHVAHGEDRVCYSNSASILCLQEPRIGGVSTEVIDERVNGLPSLSATLPSPCR